MDTLYLLRQAALTVWHDKSLWLLGLLSSSGKLFGNLVRIGVVFGLPVWMGSTDLPEAELNRLLSQPESWVTIRSWVIVGLTLTAAAFLLLWIVSTIAEGGLIAAIASRDNGRHLNLRGALAQGYRHLVQFIGVDTILYFPAFAILLLFMLTAAAVIASILFTALSGSSLISAEGTLSAAAACLTPLLLMLLPVYLLTQLFRRVAFRKVMLAQTGVRGSIAEAWQLIRRKPGSILVAAALLWGITYLFSWTLRLVELPLFGIIFLPFVRSENGAVNFLAESSLWLPLLHAVVLLVSAGVTALLHAFISTAWTMVILAHEQQEQQ